MPDEIGQTRTTVSPSKTVSCCEPRSAFKTKVICRSRAEKGSVWTDFGCPGARSGGTSSLTLCPFKAMGGSGGGPDTDNLAFGNALLSTYNELAAASTRHAAWICVD